MASVRASRRGRVDAAAVLLGVTFVSSAVAAALLWRAHQERVEARPTGPEALVAEGQRLLDAGEAALAATRFGEALVAAPDRVDALVGRARARRAAEAGAGAVRDDLDRALALAPRDPDALRLQAELCLERGDLRGAATALDRALEGVGAAPGAGATVDALADLRRRVAEAARAEEAAIERAEALLGALEGASAVQALEAARAAAPGSAALAAALAGTLGEVGRAEQALRLAEEAERLDPDQALDPVAVDALRLDAQAAARAPGAPVPLERWWGHRGGVWRLEGEVVAGTGKGRGEFDLALLLPAVPRAGPEHTISVDVSLGPGSPGAYAGVVVGARGADDFYLVYVFHDLSFARTRLEGPELDAYRRKHDAWPKFVRVARMLEGRWQHRATQNAAFGDTGWASLRVEVRGNELTPVVNGKRGDAVRLDRPLDGRAGLAKFYDTEARWRGLRVEER
ncbi:MAG: hypothetical protein M9894_21185 [Planctomycetes bacterium]|nr:hypothetical protein [Planctomycetota bacterium]